MIMASGIAGKIGQLYDSRGNPFQIILETGSVRYGIPDGLAQEDEGTGITLIRTDAQGVPINGPGMILMEFEIKKIEKIKQLQTA